MVCEVGVKNVDSFGRRWCQMKGYNIERRETNRVERKSLILTLSRFLKDEEGEKNCLEM